jgi:hypothetical protein
MPTVTHKDSPLTVVPTETGYIIAAVDGRTVATFLAKSCDGYRDMYAAHARAIAAIQTMRRALAPEYCSHGNRVDDCEPCCVE